MTARHRERSQITEVVSRLHGSAAVRAPLALADQAVVSGVSFLTTIVIGRTCGKLELGVFSLGMSIVLLAIAAQQSLISAAHTVFSARLEGEPRRHYNGAVAIQFASLCLLIAIGLGCASLVLGFWQGPSETTAVLNALWLACPCILLREFARRFEFARFNMAGALLFDSGIAVLQLGSLGMLAYAGLLSGMTGLLAIGAACGLTGSLWYLGNRSQFHLARAGVGNEFKQGWRFGRWVFAGQVSFAMVGFSIQWIMAGMIGEAAVGVYSASMMLVLLANPIVLGLQNLLSPSIAKAMHQGGREKVRQVVVQSTAGLTLMMLSYLSIIVFWGDSILTHLYGESFAGNGFTVGLLGWGALATAVGVSSNHGLRTIERPELNFVASLIGLAVGVVTAWCLIPTLAVSGAALAFAFSCTLTSCIRIVGFLIASRSSTEVRS